MTSQTPLFSPAKNMVSCQRTQMELKEERIQSSRLVIFDNKQRVKARHQTKTSKQRVSFAKHSEEIGVSSADTVSIVWYSLAELLSFKKSFKRMSRMSLATMLPYNLEFATPAFVPSSLVRVPNKSASSATPSPCIYKTALYISPHNDDPNHETTARGLEYASCFERQQRTVRGRQVLLRLATKVDASELARIATQCNAWATQLAVEQALEDAADAGGQHCKQSRQQQQQAIML